MFALRVLMLWFALGICTASAAIADDLNLLFLGDQGHHQPANRARHSLGHCRRSGTRVLRALACTALAAYILRHA